MVSHEAGRLSGGRPLPVGDGLRLVLHIVRLSALRCVRCIIDAALQGAQTCANQFLPGQAGVLNLFAVTLFRTSYRSFCSSHSSSHPAAQVWERNLKALQLYHRPRSVMLEKLAKMSLMSLGSMGPIAQVLLNQCLHGQLISFDVGLVK